MKQYHLNYSEEIDAKMNESIAKRALNKKRKPEKVSEYLRNLILEDYERGCK